MKKAQRLFLSMLALVLVSTPALAEETAFTLRPGDVLDISVWKEDGLQREALVLPDGTITFPLIGQLPVEGLTVAKAQDALKEKLKKLIPDASVSIMVKAPMGHTVSIIGQVQKPGEVVISRRLTALQALSQVGGLTTFADEGNIIVIRQGAEGKTAIELPYRALADGDHLDKDVDLVPGDIIMVPTAGLF